MLNEPQFQILFAMGGLLVGWLSWLLFFQLSPTLRGREDD